MRLLGRLAVRLADLPAELAWRRSFTGFESIVALRNAIYTRLLEGVRRLTA